MTHLTHRPVVIVVRDGWGANPYPQWNHANAVHLGRTPVDGHLMATYPHTLIQTSGVAVGLPPETMGNSEVGHQNIGAGRVVEQEIMRITGRIHDETFFSNEALVAAFDRAGASGGAVHVIGLCSDGRVHSDLDHLYAVMELSRKLGFPGRRVFIHALTDGRDTAPDSGRTFVADIERRCAELGINPIASVCGRYWAMDRDDRWERVQRAHDLLIGRGDSPTFASAADAVEAYYRQPAGDSMHGDEFIPPSAVSLDVPGAGRVRDGDSVIFFNYRGDRPRELVKAFTCNEFPYEGTTKHGTRMRLGFDRGPRLDLLFVTMTAYEEGLPVRVAFGKPPRMADTFGEYVAGRGLRQFRCAETEKYPHVTFFFNDYRDDPFPGEERMLVDSPRDVATYDQKPQMSAWEVTAAMLEAIASDRYDAYVLNYANGDMVGHTGSLPAAIQAVEAVDACVGRVVEAVLGRGGALIVTADHGNCEQMIDPKTGGPHTAHTTYPVELIVVAKELQGRRLRGGGRLADIAPTALELMGLPKPEAMTGTSLIAP